MNGLEAWGHWGQYPNRDLWCVRYLMGNSYFRPAQSSKPFDTSAHWFEPVGNWENILYAEFASSCDLHLHGGRYSAIMYQKRFFYLLTRGQCMFMHRSMFLIRNKLIWPYNPPQNSRYISSSGEFRDKGNYALQLSFYICNCTLPLNW